jgi:putative PIN family toxin of toxin-antitoxin system
MSMPLRKAVYDCNIYLQALSNPLGPAGQCVQEALQRRVILFVDDLVLASLQEVASRAEIAQKLRILSSRVVELVDDLRRVAIFIEEVPTVFQYDRDPDDAHCVNLALAAGASLVVSRDRDLLDLMDEKLQEGRSFRARFPSLPVLNPVQFLTEIRSDKP